MNLRKSSAAVLLHEAVTFNTTNIKSAWRTWRLFGQATFWGAVSREYGSELSPRRLVGIGQILFTEQGQCAYRTVKYEQNPLSNLPNRPTRAKRLAAIREELIDAQPEIPVLAVGDVCETDLVPVLDPSVVEPNPNEQQ